MLACGVVASSFYSSQTDLVLELGDTDKFGEYTFSYVDLETTLYSDRIEEIAVFNVWKGDKFLGRMYPYRATYPEFNIAATRGAINSSIIEDFYLVPSEFGDNGGGVFRVLINPLVWWMWASGPVLVIGTVISLIPRGRRHKIPALSSKTNLNPEMV